MDLFIIVFVAPLLVSILTALFEYWLNSRNK
ncbi:type I toxin-antitoxin system Fst family toxin [Streptococcus sp. P25B114]|nr:type I toxin-antitoxin system Fst family toxin [Streptococcus suis]NQI33645.1 type I toxin-antitoxin system Fst family toxin [Streptococcus suis]NQL61491.1 type I toxin-antitoxin system Fst family toxin [Streptococcus suis]NQM37885.1 type I toxin-antitoxin system Fst family toxin [Streptococcus suis]NQO45782.1 type I toxin-antitoxin system Fst family toxin [Streptococcus suis]NQP65721.1 type I toxin-antitoxin system Fst family toxin [Streptococcus suis]